MAADDCIFYPPVYDEVTNISTDTTQIAAVDSISQKLSTPHLATIVGHVHITIDWLQRFSALIANDSAASQYREADNEQLTDEPSETLQDSTSNRFKSMVRQDCPNLPEFLEQRLLKAMFTRHKNISFRRSIRRPSTLELKKPQEAPLNIPARVLMEPESGRAFLPRAGINYTTSISLEQPGNPYSGLPLNLKDDEGHAASLPTSQAGLWGSLPHRKSESPPEPQHATVPQTYGCGYCYITFTSDEALHDLGWP